MFLNIVLEEIRALNYSIATTLIFYQTNCLITKHPGNQENFSDLIA